MPSRTLLTDRMSRLSHTPRGPRSTDRLGRPGTLPPVPGRPSSSRHLWLATLLLLVALSVLTWQVLADGPLLAADERLGDTLRGDTLPVQPAELLADLGNMTVAPPLLLAAMVHAAVRTRRWWPALCYALALGLMAALVSVLKAWTDRPGPLGGTGFFPSGHAGTAAVAFGAAALLLTTARAPGPPREPSARDSGFPTPARRVPRAWWGCRRWGWLILAALLTLANGLGLVWRGYHWPLDVLASWLLSGLLLAWAARSAAAHP